MKEKTMTEKKIETFSKGDTVTWLGEAGGFQKQRVGEVIVLIPKGADPAKVIPDGVKIGSTKVFINMRSDRYLVSEARKHRSSGKDLPPAFYAPVASKVQKATLTHG